jgi:hypothetical protein
MAIDGNYNVEIDTPMGKQTAKLTLKTDGNSLSGSVDSAIGGVVEFSGGTANGDDIAWAMKVNSPMGSIDLEYKGKITGDDITGEVKLGNFGTSPLKGKRA